MKVEARLAVALPPPGGQVLASGRHLVVLVWLDRLVRLGLRFGLVAFGRCVAAAARDDAESEGRGGESEKEPEGERGDSESGRSHRLEYTQLTRPT
jgi:hypothetical protein